MKADLTKPEVRAAFMALYWGQKVYRNRVWKDSVEPEEYYCDSINQPSDTGYLSLRHISSLTEEETFWLIWNLLSDQSIDPIEKDELTIDITDNDGSVQADFDLRCGSGTISFHIDNDLLRIKAWMEDESDIVLNHGAANDYLRNIGILIPYRGNSCEELISAGLVVYRKEETI